MDDNSKKPRMDRNSLSIIKWHQITDIAVKAEEGRLEVVTEMAISLDDFLVRVEGIMFQLVQNWCLCKWCQMFNPENDLFSHWRNELSANLRFLMSPTLKNRRIDKGRHFSKVLVDDYDLDDPERVYEEICDKFSKEHILDSESISNVRCVAGEFPKSISEIVELMSSSNGRLTSNETKTKAAEYIDRTFNV